MTTHCGHGVPDDKPCYQCEMVMLSDTTRTKIKVLEDAVRAADNFFKTVMPHMNVKDSALGAQHIGDWNRAEIKIAAAMRSLK